MCQQLILKQYLTFLTMHYNNQCLLDFILFYVDQFHNLMKRMNSSEIQYTFIRRHNLVDLGFNIPPTAKVIMETGPCFIVSSDKLEKPRIKLQHLVYKTSDIL